MSKFHFESALEKLARILARQYNIEVVFEGGDAKTDGKKIFLPHFKDLTDELRQDLNGFLDHEVSHCKFTDFDAYKAVKRKFTRTLVNATEDIRIEQAMKAEFSGTKFNLEPLRDKLMKEARDNWSLEVPMASRLIQNIQWAMEGRTTIIDEQIKPYMDAIEGEIENLRSCKSTKQIISVCEKIAKLIDEEREKEKDSKESESESEKSGETGESKGSKSSSKGESESEESSEEGDSEESDSEESESDSEESESKESSKPAEGKSSKSKSKSEKARKKFDEMMAEKEGEKTKSDFDKYSLDIEDLMNERLKDHIEKTEDKKRTDTSYSYDTSGDSISIPLSTRYDTVTDHSGKGDSTKYRILRTKVKKHVGGIKAQLEKVLKVKENARWRMEREAGKINSRALSKLGSDKSYRSIFKDYSKTETNNVAVEILVDMSGSMSGRMETAKMATIAMAEALKELNISFEVTGFNSVPERKLLSIKKDSDKYNRVRERLDLHVFKSFDVASLSGIEKLFVGEQNPDGECVKWAAQRLALRKEKRKILLVLSDGQPATGESDSRKLQSDLKLKIAQIEKSGIECVGIGIQTDAVKHFYKDYIIVSSIESLPKESMSKLSKLIGA